MSFLHISYVAYPLKAPPRVSEYDTITIPKIGNYRGDSNRNLSHISIFRSMAIMEVSLSAYLPISPSSHPC